MCMCVEIPVGVQWFHNQLKLLANKCDKMSHVGCFTLCREVLPLRPAVGGLSAADLRFGPCSPLPSLLLNKVFRFCCSGFAIAS